MGRLFVQKYFQLHLNFNNTVNYTLSSGRPGPGLIPIEDISLFLIWPFTDVMCSIISVNNGGIKENNRRDLVINYCKTLDANFSILEEAHVNICYLQDIRELGWRGHNLARKDTNLLCSSPSKENSPSYRINNNWLCKKICFLQNQKHNRRCFSLICPLWNNEEWRIDRCLYEKLRNYCIKRLPKKLTWYSWVTLIWR